MISSEDLREYLELKMAILATMRLEFQQYPFIRSLFERNRWYEEIESQILVWQSSPAVSTRERRITVPAYELFRYLEEDDIRNRFISSLQNLESITSSDPTRHRRWAESVSRLFSNQTAQIYSGLFEILVLGELISTGYRVEPYHENIDGRILIENRYVYFEIKSLQKTRFDLEGIGAGGVSHDEHQILMALNQKATQLAPYEDDPALIIVSLYNLADQTTGSWFTMDFFDSGPGRKISAVVLYDWFTGGAGKQVLLNPEAIHPLAESARAIFSCKR